MKNLNFLDNICVERKTVQSISYGTQSNALENF